jgi:sugar lactone lactonase
MTETHSFTGRILSDIACQLGEGPTYDPASGKAFWFDIRGQKLHELHLSSMAKTEHDLPFLGSGRLRPGAFHPRSRRWQADALRET